MNNYSILIYISNALAHNMHKIEKYSKNYHKYAKKY